MNEVGEGDLLVEEKELRSPEAAYDGGYEEEIHEPSVEALTFEFGLGQYVRDEKSQENHDRKRGHGYVSDSE